MTTKPSLSIGRIERHFASGRTEELVFSSGVNLLVGVPNSGKTKWLQTLDFLLGDPDQNPFEGAEEAGLADKYDAAGAELLFGSESYWIERRWRQAAAKTKVFVDEEEMPAREFQTWLTQKLGIPLVHFPKGNPTSGQTWPELTFRMLLRHMYRRQRLWNDIADKQPEGEQHACLLQFLGLAADVFSEEYGQLVKLKMEVDRLRGRRDQHSQTLEELARDVMSEPGFTVGVNAITVQAAENRLAGHIDQLSEQRTALLSQAQSNVSANEPGRRLTELGEQRAAVLQRLEEAERKAQATQERLEQLRRYRDELVAEIERLDRAADAGEVLADLKITHCPACDQPVSNHIHDANNCFLCHQAVPVELSADGLGAVRVRYEQNRLDAELKEADQLLSMVEAESRQVAKDIRLGREQLHRIEGELRPARQSVSALVQQEVSAIDMALGEAHERQRHLGRVKSAMAAGEDLTRQIAALEQQIEPLAARFDETTRALDFDAASAILADGMNAYLNEINNLRENVWRHRPVTVDVSRSSFSIKIGGRRWSVVLGGTDTLYFLMAYHYGLLSLTNHASFNYPGFCIIDVPGEFSGEAVQDKENFIVQPFIDLLSGDDFEGSQLIITGAAFTGLTGVHRNELTHVYTA